MSYWIINDKKSSSFVSEIQTTNVNNVHKTSSQKYRHISIHSYKYIHVIYSWWWKRMNDVIITLGYENINFFTLLGVKASVIWETETGKRMEIDILIHNFFSNRTTLCYLQGPHSAPFASRPGLLNWWPVMSCSVGRSPSEVPSHLLVLP